MIKNKIYKYIKRKRIATVEELAESMGCAVITVRKVLSDNKYLSSYNLHAKYHTLRELADFNEEGIWKHSGALFTKKKSLDRLLVDLIDRSPSGYAARELDGITAVSTTKNLKQLAKIGQIRRIRSGRDYYYFSVKLTNKADKQVQKRLKGTDIDWRACFDDEKNEQLSVAHQTIMVLLEVIRARPRSKLEFLRILAKRHPKISQTFAIGIVDKYSIDLKKKIDEHSVFFFVASLAAHIRTTYDENYCLHLHPEAQNCPTCGSNLLIKKTTKPRTFFSLRFGSQIFKETITFCPEHDYDPETGESLVYISSFLRSVVAPGKKLAFDSIVRVGKLRFEENKQIVEIREKLRLENITLETSSISRYIDFFLACIECLHISKLKKLKMLIKEKGGYLLHIDSTTETKSDTVFVCFDSITGIVLLSEKIPTEKQSHIEKQLRKVKRQLGSPLAIMMDMSDAMNNAATAVFPKSVIRICQCHLLKDIGKDLIGPLNISLGKVMSKLKINAGLNRMRRELEHSVSAEHFEECIEVLNGESFVLENLTPKKFVLVSDAASLRVISWIQNYKSDGTGLGFPFERSRLLYYSRMRRAYLNLKKLEELKPKEFSRCSKFKDLKAILERSSNQSIVNEVRALKKSCKDFDILRNVLRFELKDGTPITQSMSIRTLTEVKAYNRQLSRYVRKLRSKCINGTATHEEEVIYGHMEKYQSTLFVSEDLVKVFMDKGSVRTNNEEEGLFRDLKRRRRRTSGKKDISREFNAYGPYLPLLTNLTKEDYVNAVIGSEEDLPLRISELDPKEIEYYLQKLSENRKGKHHLYIKKMDDLSILPHSQRAYLPIN